MSFADEVGGYRFRLLGPGLAPTTDGRYLLPRGDGGVAIVLQSPELPLAAGNVFLGRREPELKAPLRKLGAPPACGAIVNAAVRHMAPGLGFASQAGEDADLALAARVGNEERSADADRIGVFVQDGGASYRGQLLALQDAEGRLADDGVLVIPDANRRPARQAMRRFLQTSRRTWRVVLDETTAAEDHPTLGNGLLLLQCGADAPDAPIRLSTETDLDGPHDRPPRPPRQQPPFVTVLHYRNPWVGAQDYPNFEGIALDPGQPVADAFAASGGDYVVVLDADAEIGPHALSEAVRRAEGGPRPARRRPRMRRSAERTYRPLAQAEYFPAPGMELDDGDGPSTVTVAPALSVTRDNLVAFDLDPALDDPGPDLVVRFSRGLRLDGPAARCSRVPDGVVAGRVGAVLAPSGEWLVESVGSVQRAWPDLSLDERGQVALEGPPQESDRRVATIACELRRDWWTENYGHWTFDVLTRVAMLLRAGIPDDVDLLVPEPILPFHRDTLVGLGIAKQRIVPWDGTPTRFRAVYVPTARPAGEFVFPAGIELLRSLVRRDVEAEPTRRVFVSRGQLERSTRIANEEALIEIAVGAGFEHVMPETLKFRDQLQLFAEAEIVVGPHGSGLANAVYMAPGTTLWELAQARLHAEKVPNFWNLAACGRQRYALCVAGDKRINPKRFRRVLRDLTRHARHAAPRERLVAETPPGAT